ncbi:MAG: DUF4404 family protein [Anaerolineales bacterium]|nr:DUF4404 family protein [Anaerolineales bacterium]
MRELSADIRELLERAESKQPAPSMMDRIESSIEHFGVSHPTSLPLCPVCFPF